jgi:hypothetical protein
MTDMASRLTHLSDADLLTRVKHLAERERHATAHLIASLAELDSRRLYLGEGCSSLFTYCTQVLHLSEHAAYGRIEAARAARRFPIIFEWLAEGSLTLTAVGLLSRHLSIENHRTILDIARHKSKREIEELVARLQPRPALPSAIGKLPSSKPSQSPNELPKDARPSVPAPAACDTRPPEPPRCPAVVRPLSPERYRVQFTVGRETHEKLRRAQDLLRHTIPTGDPVAIFDRALTLLVAELEKAKLAAAARPPRAPRPTAHGSRHIPAAVKRAVWARDGGRCAFVGTAGRCRETGFLEFHHVVPYAAGGQATVENIHVRCRRHNAYEAEQHFGPLFVRESSTRSGPSCSVVPWIMYLRIRDLTGALVRSAEVLPVVRSKKSTSEIVKRLHFRAG